MAGLLAVLLPLTVGAACSADGSSGGPDGASTASPPGQDGPLRVTQSDLGTAIVFGAPGEREWSATAGSFELCSTSPDTVMTGAHFVHESRLLDSGAVIRHFVGGEDAGGRVEPILAGFGIPPKVGDQSPRSRRRLAGSFEDVNDSHAALPVCEDARGSDAVVELMVSATVSAAGGRAKDVALSYTVAGTPYEWTMPLTMVLCGSEVTNEDC